LNPHTLHLFEGIDVYTFITGRGITAANDPMKAAQNFKDEIIRIWG
ncbi:3-keto-L-gulonate-6-phosphate decarboxylase, partial [Enterococcus faecium MRSN 4777]